MRNVRVLSKAEMKRVIGGGTGCGVNYYAHDGTWLANESVRNLSMTQAKDLAGEWNVGHQQNVCFQENGCAAVAKLCCDSCL